MRAILPGKPQAREQAVSAAQWEDLRLVVCLKTAAQSITPAYHAFPSIGVYIRQWPNDTRRAEQPPSDYIS